MNDLTAKSLELVSLAREYGITPAVQVNINSATVRYNNRLYSVLTFTDTGKVSVKTWDKTGSKHESVSKKVLGEYLAFYAANTK